VRVRGEQPQHTRSRPHGGKVMRRSAYRGVALIAAVVSLLGATGEAAAQPIYNPPPGQNFEGVWLIQGEHSVVKTIEGKLPPMTRTAAARYAAAVAARKAGKPDFDTIQTCKPHGFPRILFAAFPIEVLQEPKQVTFIHEIHHMPRMVYLDLT